MNKKRYFTTHVVVIFTLLLSSCANKETRFIVAPTIILENNFVASSVTLPLYESLPTVNNHKIISLTVSDLRIKKHLVDVLHADKATRLIPTERLLASVIKESLTIPLTKQGVVIAQKSSNELTLSINKANISVQQSLTTYSADTVIELQVIINNQIKTLTKTFQTNAISNGLLSVDIAVLERDFNQELSTLLKQIIIDKDIHSFLH